MAVEWWKILIVAVTVAAAVVAWIISVMRDPRRRINEGLAKLEDHANENRQRGPEVTE